MNELKRVAIYARVSTDDQSIQSQMRDLREYCEVRKWTIVAEFKDEGISGSVDERAGVRDCKTFATRGKVDIVLVWAFDRFARSTQHLLRTLEQFRDAHVDFVSYQQNIDTTTATGKMVFTFLAAIAEFERSLIRERVCMGLRRAKEEGRILGRPTIPDDKLNDIMGYAGKKSIRDIAALVGVSKSKVATVLSRKPVPNVALSVVGDAVGI